MCGAKRWLARGAPSVKIIRNLTGAAAPACRSLVSCLPALEEIKLTVRAPVGYEDLGCLLEALAGCPHLRALDLGSCRFDNREPYDGLHWLFPAHALAQLSSLTSLALNFGYDPYALADVLGALASLRGLVKLCIGLAWEADKHLVPAALGQLKALRSLTFAGISTCVLEAGCLDLPMLQGLAFVKCVVPNAEVLSGVSALQCLTGIYFELGMGPLTNEPQLAKIPGLQRLVLSQGVDPLSNSGGGPLRLPADMGALSATLLYLDISGHVGTRFPLALTQLVALEHLNAERNDFAELPSGTTALSRLTKLMLGRNTMYDRNDPLQLHEKCPLDVRPLGDLSHFPALRVLTFEFCEVMLCHSVPGAARHSSLARLCFRIAHPAPECALAVLQLSQELWRLGQGSVLEAGGVGKKFCLPFKGFISKELKRAKGRAPYQKFKADLEACRLVACGP